MSLPCIPPPVRKTPVELAAEVYQREPCARSFAEDLEAHLLRGVVISRPDFFAMIRPVVWTDDRSKWWAITNCWEEHPAHLVDCWHVYLMAGDMLAGFRHFPRHLPLISFERRNSLRCYRLDELSARLQGCGTVIRATHERP